jgi:hypothetical protein
MQPENKSEPRYVSFANSRMIAQGSELDVALAAWNFTQSHPRKSLLTFDRQTGAVIDLDLRGTSANIVGRYSADPETLPKRGRPKLGVVAREVTLLPRHWDWLATQQGGASVALRRLIDAARKGNVDQDITRLRLAAAYKFMSAIAGDLPLFEEASRALFSKDFPKLQTCMRKWPVDIRSETMHYLNEVPAKPKA